MTLVECSCGRIVSLPEPDVNIISLCRCGEILSAPLFQDAEAAPRHPVVDVSQVSTPERARLIPFHVDQAAARNLGYPSRHFRSMGPRAMLLCMVAGAVWFVACVGYIIAQMPSFRSEEHSELGVVFLMGIGLGPLLFFIGARVFLNPVDVLLCPGGIIWADRTKSRVIPWDDLRYVEFEIVDQATFSTGPYRTYTLHLESDTKIRINAMFSGAWFSNVQRLVEHIVEARNAFLLDKARRAFHAGQTLDFSALSVNHRGLQKGSEWLSWDEVGRVVQRKEFICALKKGSPIPWWQVPADEVKDATVFVALAQEVILAQR